MAEVTMVKDDKGRHVMLIRFKDETELLQFHQQTGAMDGGASWNIFNYLDKRKKDDG